jgi:hypothetical protein
MSPGAFGKVLVFLALLFSDTMTLLAGGLIAFGGQLSASVGTNLPISYFSRCPAYQRKPCHLAYLVLGNDTAGISAIHG